MARIEGIGGGSMANAVNTPKSRPQNTEIRVSDAAPREQRLNVPVVTAAESKGDSQTDTKRQEGEIFGKDVTPEQAKAAVEDLNRQVKQPKIIKHTQLSFKYHEDTNRISITVTDSDTDEVIREIPPEKALDMLAKAWEMAGLLVDEKR
ncbi:MAG: flagellar protein FlaG [Clostridium sp.]|nr:flagellar protein FlaG [Clostridium sp.]MCM1207817.1 flagellar protein FlaG [Ruminococcus sp.]